jgi:hypothetical protein
MPRNQLSFFAATADSEELLRALETKYDLYFAKAGLFDTPAVEVRQSLFEISDLGIVFNGDANQATTYLIVEDAGLPLEARVIEQRDGKKKYAIDQIGNQKTVAFRPGGAFRQGILVAGQVGTASQHRESVELYRVFESELRRQFKKIKSFYLGKEAAELLDRGWRLTANARSPSIYDLRRD